MKQTWRWYGPNDPVTLSDIRQAGATGIVTALHDIPNGDVWTLDRIIERKTIIEDSGLVWSVVESVPIHEDIKTRTGRCDQLIENYEQTLRNLAQCDIRTICYNFMPVLDWTRTDLDYVLPSGSKALRFDHIDFSVFELHILKRPGARRDYSSDELVQAQERFIGMPDWEKVRLTSNIIAGLPGSEEGYTLDQFRERLSAYKNIDESKFRKNFVHFLRAIIPVAEEVGVRMAIHPDDPPYPILGLPRIVSSAKDMQWIAEAVDSPANGFTMCTGSYGVRSDNDLVSMVRRFGKRIYFAHLRSTKRGEDSKTFHEAEHLYGDIDMYAIVKAIIEEEYYRKNDTGKDDLIPMRPDHGHQMLDDLSKKTNPGYSAIGRLKGLAELRGVEIAIKRAMADN